MPMRLAVMRGCDHLRDALVQHAMAGEIAQVVDIDMAGDNIAREFAPIGAALAIAIPVLQFEIVLLPRLAQRIAHHR